MALLLALLAAALLPLAAQAQTPTACIPAGAFDPAVNYFSTVFLNETFALPITVGTTITDAYNFTVKYQNYYKLVKDTHADTTYALYLCGAPKPSLNAPVNGVFQVPLTSYGMNTDVPANYLQLLGVVKDLQKVIDAPMVDACMQKVVQGLNPPAPFTGPVVDAGYGPLFNAPNISFSATQDQGVLNRAEWIKYLALFYNLEDRAQKVFDNITAQYACLKNSAPAGDPKPTAAWLSYYDNTWYLSDAKYKMELLRDAGAVSVDTSVTFFNLSLPQDVASFQKMLQSVDVVLDETFLPTGPPGYTISNFTQNARISGPEAERLQANVWSIYGQWAQGAPFPATAWYESGVSQPQAVLKDILSIMHPAMFPDYKPTYFYNVLLGKATEVTAAQCTASDPTAQVEPTNAAPSCLASPVAPSGSNSGATGAPSSGTAGASGAGTPPPGKGATAQAACSLLGSLLLAAFVALLA